MLGLRLGSGSTVTTRGGCMRYTELKYTAVTLDANNLSAKLFNGKKSPATSCSFG